MKKGITTLMILLIFLIIPMTYTYGASEEETIQSQQDEFKINEFIDKSEQYTGEFFEGIDIQEILNQAIKERLIILQLSKEF